ncbi:MAG: tetratricopeptide repeat protein [Bacteroidales bacterium]|nr:tetratricopeptide repeat protein [Bacteroidales bacterium]
MEEYINHAKSVNFKPGLMEALDRLGHRERQEGNYSKAIEHHLQSLAIATELGDSNQLAYNYSNLGQAYRRQDYNIPALQYFHKALKIQQAVGDLKNTPIILRKEGEFTQFEGNTFSNIATHPIDICANHVHTIGANNTFNAAANTGILVNSYKNLDVPGNYTWLNHDAPYVIGGELRIGAEGNRVNLTIEPGTTVKFLVGAGFQISYWDEHYAKLIAEGTATDIIIFTSNSPAPAKGDWDGLFFYKGVAGSSLKHCEILYAGSSEYYGAMALSQSGTNTITIENSRIAYSKSHSISVDEASIDYSTVTFEDNNGVDYKVF